MAIFLKDALSGIGHLHAGVLQGYVLDPLMFLIFINDITDEIVGLGRLFSDDTSIGHNLPSLYKSVFTQTVSNALLISANVTLVTCFASNASNIV
jgi:hypothetical protein